MIGEIKKLYIYIKWITDYAKGFLPSIAVILVIEVLGALDGVAIAIASKSMMDSAVSGFLRQAAIAAAIFVLLIAMSLIISALSTLISVKASEDLSNRIRKRLFIRVARTEWLSVSGYHSGDILTRLTSDVSSVASAVVNTMPSIISLMVQLVAAFCTLFYFEPYLALLAFVLGPATVLFSRIWGRKLKKLQVKVQESESAYRSYIQEAIQNLLVIKSFQLEGKSEEKINELHGDRMKWIISRNKTSIVASTVLGSGYWAGYFLAFAWGAMKLAKKATTFGTFAAFLQLVQQVQGPFLGLSRTVPQIIASIASAGRLMELERLPLEEDPSLENFPESVGIELREVDFGYSDESGILRNASIEVRPGETIAIVGPSGEGKTTIIRLILALASPIKGQVLFKGSDGCEYSASAKTRDLIAYVPQGNTLFSGTIEDNIRCGMEEATLEEIKNAAEAASAWDFINELDDGLKTQIGEKGIGLSEGQAQRIAIARAILKNSPVLIFDEATSALDIQSEMRVLESIRNKSSKRTCIVVTHRTSALDICNRVIRLEEGKLLEVVNN